MNLKRHHVLYGLLAVSLIVALLVFLIPPASQLSYTAPSVAEMSASASTSASTSASATTATSSDVLPMRFEVVTTLAAEEQGLGGRKDIPENYGMLFVFASDSPVGFWMKDMLVPIDIIWLSDSGKILGIEDSLSPDTYPEIYYAPAPVKYVLETRAGEARRRGWSVGTKVALPLPYGK